MLVSCLLTLATAVWSSRASQPQIPPHAQHVLHQQPAVALHSSDVARTSSSATASSTTHDGGSHKGASISPALFAELEELARVVDITYCVGSVGAGIQPPFSCPSRCGDFPSFELVTVGTSVPASLHNYIHFCHSVHADLKTNIRRSLAFRPSTRGLCCQTHAASSHFRMLRRPRG